MKWLLDLLHALTLWLDSSATDATPPEVAWETFSTIQRSVLETIARQDNETKYALDMRKDDTDDSPLGELKHVADLTVTMESVLRIVADPSGRRFVAKFVSDCRARHHGIKGDSPLVEYSFQAALNDTGLAPKVYFLSPPSPIVPGFPMKARSGLMIANGDHCIALKAEVRMIVMEIVGRSVEAYLEWLRGRLGSDVAYFRAVMRIALKTLALIESLHSRGVIHGDIHGRNIVFREVKPMREYNLETDELILIDFGMASFFPDQLMSPEDVTCDFDANPLMMTPWQLLNKRYGRRDDLYKMLDFVASFLSDGELDAAIEEHLVRSNPILAAPYTRAAIKKACLRYRSRYSLFMSNEFFKSGCCVAMGLNGRRLREVQIGMETLVDRVTAIARPDDEPDYAFLSGALADILTSI